MITEEGFTEEDLKYINEPFTEEDLLYIKIINHDNTRPKKDRLRKKL